MFSELQRSGKAKIVNTISVKADVQNLKGIIINIRSQRIHDH
jgi:hypothetical protein